MIDAYRACEELGQAAARHRDVVEGFELDAEESSMMERTLCGEDVTEVSFSLRQRLVRTAGSRVAYVRSEDSEESLSSLCTQAADLARVVAATDPVGLVEPERGETISEGSTLCDAEMPTPHRDAMDRAAQLGLSTLLQMVPDAMQPQCTVRFYAEGHTVVNSRGLMRRGAVGRYQMRLGYIAHRGDELNPVECRAYATSPEAFDVPRFAQRCVLLGESSLGNEAVVSGSYPVVIPGYVLSRMLMGFWGIFSAQKIADGQSMLARCEGREVAAPLVTIVDDSSLSGGGPKLDFDVQGSAKGRTVVVEGGVFREPLSDLGAAARLQLDASSGNAARRDTLGRIVPNEITIAPSNFAMLPGSATLDELLIQMGDGILLTEVNDIYHSFALASGDISTPCSAALVRGGKLVGGVSSLTLSDTIQNLLSRIVGVGRDMAWVDLEDLNAYYTGAPDVLVSSLNFVGSA